MVHDSHHHLQLLLLAKCEGVRPARSGKVKVVAATITITTTITTILYLEERYQWKEMIMNKKKRKP